mgnify:CR=1 FL=1
MTTALMKVPTIFNKDYLYLASVGLGGHGGRHKVDNDPDHFWDKLYPKFHGHRLKNEGFHDYLQS